jgi:putative CRISPR-associated protein (TIGR02619 family)
LKTYVCTCGTSIVANSGITLDRLKHLPISEWTDRKDDIEAVRDSVCDSLARLSLPRDLNDTSAEIKGLVKMGITQADRVILIASDTVEGRLSAELVKEFLKERELSSKGQVEIKTIAGLQATDGAVFQREGLKNLLAYLVSLENDDLILNPTGGYKSVVPYISLIGMLFNKPVRYIHEDSNDVLTLTNLPVLLNDDLILLVEPKLKRIEQETAIPKNEWQVGIDYHDHRFDCLIEESGDQITLSGIGFLFWERFKQDYPIDLLRDDRNPSEKINKLLDQGVDHHGVEKIRPIAIKLLRSPYVKAIPKSCDNQPNSKDWIKALYPQESKTHLQREAINLCMVTHIHSDAGYSFLLETTATTQEENKRIAHILNRKYFK